MGLAWLSSGDMGTHSPSLAEPPSLLAGTWGVGAQPLGCREG